MEKITGMASQAQEVTTKQLPGKKSALEQGKKTAQDGGTDVSQGQKGDISKDIDSKKEASEAAQKAVQAQKKAKSLTQAAAAAGDPEERQKLLNEALQKEVEAQNFGKTAKYLNSGAFQGMVAGTGFGGGIGVGLGTITGSIVGGATGTVTGGLGAGVGAGVGYLHGPFFKVEDMMSAGIKKLTGNLPGWKGTEEQKQALEKMVQGVQSQETPSDADVENMASSGGYVDGAEDVYAGWQGDREQRTWKKTAGSYVPSMPKWAKGGGPENSKNASKPERRDSKTVGSTEQQQHKSSSSPRSVSSAVSGNVKPGAAVTPSSQTAKKPGTATPNKDTQPKSAQREDQSAKDGAAQTKLPDSKATQGQTATTVNGRSNMITTQGDTTTTTQKKQPRKLERSTPEQPSQAKPTQKKPPRKLKMRSTKSADAT